MQNDIPALDGKVYRKKKKKTLLCPKCGRGRLIDESIDTTSEVHIVAEDDPWPADYYAKCCVCKAEVGVRKLNRE